MNRGGAEAMLMTLYRAVDRSRIQFDFLEMHSERSHYADEIERMGGRLLKCRWSQSPSRIIETIAEVKRVIDENGPYSAVHSHILFGSGSALLAAKKARIPVRIAHSHSTSSQRTGLVSMMYRSFARALIRSSATHLVGCTLDAGAYLFGTRSFEKGGSVIPNAVDTHQFRPGSENERRGLKLALAVSADSYLLVSVARMEQVKNHEFLIRVAAELEARGVNFELLFVGDGSRRGLLEEQAATEQIEHRIRFLGVREDIPEILRSADLLLLPSYFEGLPVVLVEAQASGLPCLVSSNVSRNADFGLNLLTFTTIDDPRNWVDLALEAGSRNRPTKVEIAEALERHGYSVESSLEKLLRLYSVDVRDA